MRQKIICILFLLSTQVVFCQTPFSKIYDLDEAAFANTLNGFVEHNDHFYLSSTLFCPNPDSADDYIHCSALTKFDLAGNMLDKVTIDSFSSGLEHSLNLFGDALIISGHNKEPFLGRQTRILLFDEQLEQTGFKAFAGKPNETINNYGFWESGGYGFVMGIINNANNPDPAQAQIYKFDDQLNTQWMKSFQYGNSALDCNDMQATPDGNHAFILWNQGEVGPGGFPAGYQILKVDAQGDTLKSFAFEDFGQQLNRLLCASDGSFYFGTRRNIITNSPFSYGQINKLNAEMDQVEWSLELPNDQLVDGRIFTMEDYIEAQNGDLIACGKVWDNSDSEIPGPDKHSSDNGFILRISPFGEVLWLRVYRNPQELLDTNTYGKFRHSNLKHIVQLESGHFAVAGEVYYKLAQQVAIDPVENEVSHLWLLLVDENGCLDANDCDEITYLTKSHDLIPETEDLQIYPNPTSDFLHLNKKIERSKYQIVDAKGRIMHMGDVEDRLDISVLTKGIYFLKIENDKRQFRTLKFVKS